MTAWTTPRTWVTGEVLSSANMNIHVRDNLSFYGGTDAMSSTPPGTPGNGQRWVLPMDSTNGVYWHMIYIQSGAYWAFVGGAPMFSEVATNETSSSTTYVALTTAGPSIVLTRPGDYDVGLGLRASIGGGGGGNMVMSYDIGGTAAADADRVEGANSVSAQRTRRKTSISASITLTAKYKILGSGANNFADRVMRVRPVKLT